MLIFFALVGLHILTVIYNGRFAIVKSHHYLMTSSSNVAKQQTTTNGNLSTSNASNSNTSTKSPEKIDIDPVMAYHTLQTAAFCLMAIIIMRLKLFFTPQLCILSALLLNTKVRFIWQDSFYIIT